MRTAFMFITLFCLFSSLYSASLNLHTINGDEIIALNEIEDITIIEPESLIFVEGGFFLMGDHYNEGWADELPVHCVTVSDFYMDPFEITHEKFIRFLNLRQVAPEGIYNGNELIDLTDPHCAIAYDLDGFVFNSNSQVSSLECPVIAITWFGACEYANWLSEIYNIEPCYIIESGIVEWNLNADGYRLPSEAEWEYACRGGMNWIDEFRYSGCHEWIDLADYAWFSYNAAVLHPGGEKLPNQLGIYDMSGNAYELCWDWFDPAYYGSSPEIDPTGPAAGAYHVSRGGDWNDDALFIRCSARYSSYPHTSNGFLGFRLVRSGLN
ncbi:MAG: formylglycine-generating enzyme family protein [Candidatus Cloacimonetes bacterium]|nr:formylglycine-generating enzyme family protein [Candidatus Cloacimonadota bacterium]